MTKIPSAFVSYSWDDDSHKAWMRRLSTQLRHDGINIILDQWHAVPGDMLPEFMEKSIRDNDFVLIICTPKYKEKSDSRTGGVGYEGDIITAELFTARNHNKFIPILRNGDWIDAAPSWLLGGYYIDLRGGQYSHQEYQKLLQTLLGKTPKAPPIGGIPEEDLSDKEVHPHSQRDMDSKLIKITGIVEEAVGIPKDDGTRGSALYEIPFQLSRKPSVEWERIFPDIWNYPPRFTTMHRPGIAKVVGDRIILERTTIEEVEKYHLETLKLVIERVNQIISMKRKISQKQIAMSREKKSITRTWKK